MIISTAQQKLYATAAWVQADPRRSKLISFAIAAALLVAAAAAPDSVVFAGPSPGQDGG